MIKSKIVFGVIMWVLVSCLILCYSSCVHRPEVDDPIVSVRIKRGSGIFCQNQYPEANESKYYVIMDVIVDDFSFASSAASQALITSLRESEPIQVDTNLIYVEVVRCIFRKLNGSEYSVHVLYDYVTNKEYILYQGDLYVIQTDAFTNAFLEPYVLNKYGDQGEHRFCNNENHTFRYIQYWQDNRADYREIYELSNLVGSKEIQNGEDAISQALIISGMNPTNICWYYDAVTDYWMVRMFDRENPYIGEREVPYVCDVIMDKNGNIVESYLIQLTNDMLIP